MFWHDQHTGIGDYTNITVYSYKINFHSTPHAVLWYNKNWDPSDLAFQYTIFDSYTDTNAPGDEQN